MNFQVIKDSIKEYNRVVKCRELFYLVGLLIVILISVLKALGSAFEQPRHYVTEEEVDAILERNKYMSFLDGLEGHNLSYEEMEVEPPLNLSKVQAKKVSKMCTIIRDHLLCNNFVLKGQILKTKFPKISAEELLESIEDLDVPYLVQHISFGEDINEALEFLYRYELKKSKKLGTSYLVIEDGGVIELEQELKSLLMNDIKIDLVDTEQKKK